MRSAADAAPEHRVHQVDAQQLAGEVLADELAVAQHGDPVADLVDLVEEVRDEQDRDAPLLEVADHAEQLGALLAVEARRRLVQDEDLDLRGDRACDRDQLLDGERVASQQRGRVDVEAEAGEHLLRVSPHRGPVDQAEPARLAAERDVLGDGDVGQQVDLLVDRARSRRAARRAATPNRTVGRPGAGRPRVRSRAPVIALIRVDLPAPFSPMSEWTSPGNSRKSTPSSAASPPKCTVAPVSSAEAGRSTRPLWPTAAPAISTLRAEHDDTLDHDEQAAAAGRR